MARPVAGELSPIQGITESSRGAPQGGALERNLETIASQFGFETRRHLVFRTLFLREDVMPLIGLLSNTLAFVLISFHSLAIPSHKNQGIHYEQRTWLV